MSNPYRIALLTDSCADLPPQVRAYKPIYVVPLQIICKDGQFADGVDIGAHDIYRRLAAGELPRTSLPDGGTVERVLDEIVAAGYQKVIAVMLSSGLSGTCNMLRVLAEHYHKLEITVFDSRSGSLGVGAIVLQLWEEICAGASWDYLVSHRTPALIEQTQPFFSVDTLEYLRKGGRIGGITAMAGTMLNIKPLISFSQDGQLQSVAKVRGRKQVQDKLVELLRRRLGEHKRYNLAVANGGAPEEMVQLKEAMMRAFPDYEHLWEGELDGTLSVYIGSGVLGAAIQILD